MRILIAIPCGDTLDVNFVDSLLRLKKPEGTEIKLFPGSLVYEARNNLGKLGTEYDYVLWLDSDMSFGADLLDRLLDDIQGKDFVSGLYFGRRPPFRPCAFARCGFLTDGEKTIFDWERVGRLTDDMMEVEAVGFGCVLMTGAALKDTFEKFSLPFTPIMGYGEDLAFCIRFRELGYRIWLDPKIIPKHTAHIPIGDETYIESWNNLL